MASDDSLTDDELAAIVEACSPPAAMPTRTTSTASPWESTRTATSPCFSPAEAARWCAELALREGMASETWSAEISGRWSAEAMRRPLYLAHREAAC